MHQFDIVKWTCSSSPTSVLSCGSQANFLLFYFFKRQYKEVQALPFNSTKTMIKGGKNPLFQIWISVKCMNIKRERTLKSSVLVSHNSVLRLTLSPSSRTSFPYPWKPYHILQVQHICTLVHRHTPTRPHVHKLYTNVYFHSFYKQTSCRTCLHVTIST